MVSRIYGDEIRAALQRLYVKDRDSFTTLWNALYDWSIVLTYCLGAVKAVTITESDLGEESVDSLQKVQTRIENLVKDMRTALIVADSSPSQPETFPPLAD